MTPIDTQNLTIDLPAGFDPLPSFTTEVVRVHLTAACAQLEVERANPRLVNGEGTALDLLIGKIKNAPSTANREYLMALLNEAMTAAFRRQSMNNDEAAYAVPGMSETAKAHARARALRAERQQALAWARAREQMDAQDKESLAIERANREAFHDAVMAPLEALDVAFTQVAPIPDIAALARKLDAITSSTAARPRVGF
ncbi:hypothetical protein [Paraburkholderia sp. C35]|uniref:hypothetical protein n=1 Tax=Paraburkholderia sp. C35 TaxID=2126993 RepID=UPI000D696AEF|nr:hypothetical protein [Paraburkholderia sp. C35]